MRTFFKAAVAAAALGGASLAAVQPVQAHDGGAAVAAGIIGLGVGAAIASSSHHYDRGYYDAGYQPYYGNGYYAPSYGVVYDRGYYRDYDRGDWRHDNGWHRGWDHDRGYGHDHDRDWRR